MRDSISSDDVLIDELIDLYGHNIRKSFYFNPFSEVVDSYYYILHTTSPFGKLVDQVDSL